MYKVMLIDDDVPVLKYLEKLIKWNELDLTICASTYSSVKALYLFTETLPDIVISDIGLPQMDGFKLAQEFKKIKPDIRMIYLTCHEEFTYAKRAFQLAADDYLIKDELTSEQLERSLKKAIKNYKSSPEYLYLWDTIHKNRDVLKQTIIDDLLKGRSFSNIVNNAKRLGIEWKYHDFLVGMSYINLSNLPQAFKPQDFAIIQYSILNIAEELAKDVDGLTPLMDKSNNIYFILNFKRRLSRKIVDEFIQYLGDLQEEIKACLKIDMTFIYSEKVVTSTQLQEGIYHLIESKYSNFYQGESIYLLSDKYKNEWNYNSDLILSSFESVLIKAFEQKEKLEVIRIIENLASISIKKRINPEIFNECIIRWIRMIEGKTHSLLNIEEFIYCIRHSITQKEVIDLLKNKMEEYFTNCKAKKLESNKEPKLQEIDQHIMDNLSQNIRSADMARLLFLNPSYFSRYFKSLSGENFTDYIHRFKMQTAEKMLRDNNGGIELIASKLGYSDRTYFSKIFKKHTGYSPGEYMKESRNRMA
ncbi:response regulator [Alkalihalobacillus sp. 1P02AB]|uniref:response regulator transcription factor n=1 Tax=Alkalihalobacillus sp. 1P02AB TaxID=3132260 RepID=UPI0039A4270B